MLIACFTFAIWLLDRAQADISVLARTNGREKIDRDNTPLRTTLRLAIASAFAAWAEWESVGIMALTFALLDFFGHVWAEQSALGKLDRGNRKRTEKKMDYISGEISTTRSGWANNPALLKHIPSFLSTRMLTCMTLLEIFVLFYVCIRWPAYGGLALGGTMLAHNVTDSLDGAVGRYRREGYVLWGYYADHCFDALYECSMMLMLWYLASDTLPYGYVGVLLMAAVVHGFHRKEWVLYQRGWAKHYTNLMGPLPMYYIEWVGGAIGLAIYAFSLPWAWVTGTVVGIVACSATGLLIWNVRFQIDGTVDKKE